MASWFYAQNGKKKGPFSAELLKQLAGRGQLHPEDMVLKEGTSKWVPAGSVKGLFTRMGPGSPLVPAEAGDAQKPFVSPVVPVAGTEPSSRLIQHWQTFGTGAKIAVLAGGGIFFSLFFCCCGPLMVSSLFSGNSKEHQKAVDDKINQTDAFWSAGQKAEAVAIYKRLMDDLLQWYHVGKTQKPAIVARVVQFELEQGNRSTAKEVIKKALNDDIAMSFESDDAKKLLAEAREEVASKELAEAREERDQRGTSHLDIIITHDDVNRVAFGNEGWARFVANKAAKGVYDEAKKNPQISKLQVRIIISKEAAPDKYGKPGDKDSEAGRIEITNLDEVRKYVDAQRYAWDSDVELFYIAKVREMGFPVGKVR